MLTKEQIEKAKECKTVEELRSLAKENNMELTRDDGKKIFARLNPESGELADEELGNVAGGGLCDSKKMPSNCPQCNSSTIGRTAGGIDSVLPLMCICYACGYEWNVF